MKCVVVTGGGSAGHVVPALPVIANLLAGGCAVHFVGSISGPERGLVAALGVAYHGVQTGKLRRYFSVANLVDWFRIPLGVWQAWRLLRRIRPEVVFSKGGFVSFPVVVGAWLNGIPVVAHESDLTPGLANRLVAPLVACLCVNFAATAMAVRRARVVVTGTPLRPALMAGDAGRGCQLLGIDERRAPAPKILLVVGGSLGAARLNEVVRAALDGLITHYLVVHICGPGKLDAALAGKPGYIQREYVDDGWGDVVAAAELVISRAGANALYEWLALAKPHLLVPLPKAASRGDQIENAAFGEQQGWSLVLPEHELNSTTLIAGVAKLAALAPAIRHRLRAFGAPDGTALIVGELERSARLRRDQSKEPSDV